MRSLLLPLLLCGTIASQTTATVASAGATPAQPETVTTNVPSDYTAKDSTGATVTPTGGEGCKVTHKGSASVDHRNKTVTISKEIVEVRVWSEKVTLVDGGEWTIVNEKQNSQIDVTGARKAKIRLKKRGSVTGTNCTETEIRVDDTPATVTVNGGDGTIETRSGTEVQVNGGTWSITSR